MKLSATLSVYVHCAQYSGGRYRRLPEIPGGRDVPYLLGGWGKRKDRKSGKLLDGERDNWKPDLTVVKATVQFLQETGRLTFQPEEGQVG